jgi:soluble lytic murein transglycosylase-like protein
MERFSCMRDFTRPRLILPLLILITVVANFDFIAKQPRPQAVVQVDTASVTATPDPNIKKLDSLLKKYQVVDDRRMRVIAAILRSSRRHELDPWLLASIVIIESRANPFAVSRSNAVGIMQIHVPTWSHVVEKESINLFKIEDNVDFGARILGAYVKRHGLDEGIKRYNGWHSDRPETVQTAEAYLRKVHSIYDRARLTKA